MWKGLLKMESSKYGLLVSLAVVCMMGCYPGPPADYDHEFFNKNPEPKQRGAHVFRFRDTTDMAFLHQNNIQWIALVPWGYQEDYHTASIRHHRGDRGDLSTADQRWVTRIQALKKKGFRIFLKPHIWIHDPSPGKWRSEIYPDNEEAWLYWKKDYMDFIIRYARIAERSGVDLFCIGTELTRLSTEKTSFWHEVIDEVKNVYTGKITYAGNWDREYKKISFWDRLDYIGIQAYFPLSNKSYPDQALLKKGWEDQMPTLEELAYRYKKKIIFSEVGFRSTADGTVRPWEWMENDDNEKEHSEETQAYAYGSLFETVWREPWFAGMYIWQIKPFYETVDMGTDKDFTPQGKMAEEVIRQGYGDEGSKR